MLRLPIVLLSLALGAVSAVLISCGSSGGGNIPATSADAMLAQLQTARDAEASGDCDGIRAAAADLSKQAGALSDAEVRIAIQKGAENLAQLAADPGNCETTTEKTTTEEPTTTEPTTTEPPTTSTTTTKPTTTTTTTKPPPTPQPQPPSGGGGGGAGGGGGLGGGGTGPGKGN
jgi:hypothetical protein